MGLALIAVDLVQDGANPTLLDLSPATGLPAGMEGFDLPAGIANPGVSGSAYGGTPVGTAGSLNLAQIGGGQNTTGGVPMAGIGEDIVVDQGIGQSGPQVVASGSFAAPAVGGEYTFSLADAIVNTLAQEMAGPPAWWQVAAATIDSASVTSFSITVCRGGDLDGDGNVDMDDVPLFVDTLLGVGGGAFAGCADVQGDGDIDGEDIAPFISALLEWR